MWRNLTILCMTFLGPWLTAMDLQMPVRSYWAMRGVAPADNLYRDVTVHRIGRLATTSPVIRVFYYRFNLVSEHDGGAERERELLLVMADDHLHGWYQVTGTHYALSTAHCAGTDLLFVDGTRLPFVPLPQVLDEAVVPNDPHRYLFHPAKKP